MSLKERILKEMVVEDIEAMKLAKEIYHDDRLHLKPGVTIEKIYNRIVELKKECERTK